jgi:hypothetical protein
MQIEGELHIPIVRNTFIEVQKPSRNSIRRKTVPADLSLLYSKVFSSCDRADTEASTDISSDGCSESIFGSDDKFDQVGLVPDPPYVPSRKHTRAYRTYEEKCDSVIRRTAKVLEASDLISNILVCEDSSDGSVMIRVRVEVGVSVECISVMAQKALLEVTKQSKSVYVMGYTSAHPFVQHQSGFSATLGAMENATRACWHVFKKGFCRHNVKCTKQHPIYQTVVQVCVERS